MERSESAFAFLDCWFSELHKHYVQVENNGQDSGGKCSTQYSIHYKSRNTTHIIIRSGCNLPIIPDFREIHIELGNAKKR